MLDFPAARRIAREVIIEIDDTLDDAIARWHATFAQMVGADPSDAQADAARRVLEMRLQNDVPPPPPPSASSSTWAKIPCEERGIPGWDPETKR